MKKETKEVIKYLAKELLELLKYHLQVISVGAFYYALYKGLEALGMVPQNFESWKAVVFFFAFLFTPLLLVLAGMILFLDTRKDYKMRRAASREGLARIRYNPRKLHFPSIAFKAVDKESREKVRGVIYSAGRGEYTFNVK